MKIRFTFPNSEANREIVDTASGGRWLLSLLPVAVKIYDFFEGEEPGSFPRKLKRSP